MLKLNMIIDTRSATLDECRAKQEVIHAICTDLMKRSAPLGVLSEDRRKLRDLCCGYWVLFHELDWLAMEIMQEMEEQEDGDFNDY